MEVALLIFWRQQIRPALAGAFEGLLAAPAFDVGVVAAEQDVGDFPAAILGGVRRLSGRV